MSEHPMATEITAVCNSVISGWRRDGTWLNYINIDGYELRAGGNGGAYTPVELVVRVETDFYLILDKSGRETRINNGAGTKYREVKESAKDWLKNSIEEAIDWIKGQRNDIR